MYICKCTSSNIPKHEDWEYMRISIVKINIRTNDADIFHTEMKCIIFNRNNKKTDLFIDSLMSIFTYFCSVLVWVLLKTNYTPAKPYNRTWTLINKGFRLHTGLANYTTTHTDCIYSINNTTMAFIRTTIHCHILSSISSFRATYLIGAIFCSSHPDWLPGTRSNVSYHTFRDRYLGRFYTLAMEMLQWF